MRCERTMDMFSGIDHDGATYEAENDQVRLNRQQQRIYNLMRDNVWRTLREIEVITGDAQASISARLRDLRKDKFGGLNVQRRRRLDPKRGIHEYRIAPTRTDLTQP
jgi:hypothetical protein